MSSEKRRATKFKKKVNYIFCEICNKKLRSQYNLRFHMIVHTGEKNYVCGICEKEYQQKWNLITHMARVHLKQKPFKCNDCKKTFGYSSHFKKHIKAHFLEKMKLSETVKKIILNPFECDFCKKGFESKYRLKLHMKIHKKKRFPGCNECGKIFATRNLYSLHVQKKHNGKPGFVCEHCRHEFFNRSSIILHLKKEHLSTILPKDGISNKKSHTSNAAEEFYKETESQKKNKAGSKLKKKPLIIFCEDRITLSKKKLFKNEEKLQSDKQHKRKSQDLFDTCFKNNNHFYKLLSYNKKYSLKKRKPEVLKKNFEFMPLLSKTLGSEQMKTTQFSNPETKITKLSKVEPTINPISSTKNNSLEAGVKPKCTGNETLQDFLKLVVQLSNRNFEGLNQKIDFYKNSICLKSANEFSKPFINKNQSYNADSYFVSTNCIEINKNKKKLNTDNIKNKINKIIFKKIVESLRNIGLKQQTTEAIELIDNLPQNNDEDILQKFLRFNKHIPDNLIMKTTEGILFWHCWLCTSKFKNRHLLARHMLIHEPQKNWPFKCEICDKFFTQSNNYKEHLLAHQNLNQYYCEKCGNGFRHKSHFNVHLKKHDQKLSDSISIKNENAEK